MQSLYRKFRLVTKHTVYTLKNIELSKAAPLESRFSGCSMNRNSFKLERSFSGAPFLLNKEIGAKVVSPASSEKCSMAPVLSSYRGLTSGNQSASLVFHLPTRNFSTSGSAPENGSAASDVPPPRIKFKRLDKTARHIMQAHSSPFRILKREKICREKERGGIHIWGDSTPEPELKKICREREDRTV